MQFQAVFSPDKPTPQLVDKRMEPLVVKSAFSAWDCEVLDESNIAVLFRSRAPGLDMNRVKYLKDEVARPITSYVYRVNLESGESELLASFDRDDLKLHHKLEDENSERLRLVSYPISNECFQIDESTKKLIATDPIEKSSELESEETIRWFKDLGYTDSRKLASHGDDALFQVKKGKDTILVFFNPSKIVVHEINWNRQLSITMAKFIDENNVHVIAEVNSMVYLNAIVKSDTWVLEKQMKLPYSKAGMTVVKWQLTEKVYRVFVLYGPDGMDYSPQCWINAYDMFNPRPDKRIINVEIKPLPHYSGHIEMDISPEDHVRLVQKAMEAGMSLREYLQQNVRQLLTEK